MRRGSVKGSLFINNTLHEVKERKNGSNPDKAINALYLTKKLEEGKIAKFWIPDVIEIVERIP
ncbi:MAG: hypothetical protein DRG83_12365, partial [Deltaproteobacteria bacterium]